jgi:site-specific recombinase XerD
LIKEFIAERKVAANIGTSRANKFTYILVGWRRFIGPYHELSIADVYTGIDTMKNGLTQKGTPFKQNTKHDRVRIFRQFLLWMIENEYSTLPERKVRRIQVPTKDTMTHKAADLITSEEVKGILAACRWSRDRALIGMLYEGGFRIGELAQMKWSDLSFDSTGIVVNVNFKTGIPRYVRIILAKGYLSQWRADYPGSPEGDALVFLNELRRPLTNGGVIKQLRRICDRAGISKHVTPHLFRHSRITHLINEGVSESVIKMIMWGSVHTTMFKVYAHLTGTDIDEELLRVYGIQRETEEKRVPKLEPRVCPNCRSLMPPVADYCALCGESLLTTHSAREEEIQKFVREHKKELLEYLDKAPAPIKT